MKEGMGMKEKLALDRGVHCQTLKDVMRDISTGRPERALMITSMEGATLCLNLDLFLLYSPLLRSIVATSYLISSPIHIRVFHFYTFFELSLVLLTTHAHGLYEFTKKFQRYRQ